MHRFALLIGLLILSGCGSNNDSHTDNSTTSPSNTAESRAETGEKPEAGVVAKELTQSETSNLVQQLLEQATAEETSGQFLKSNELLSQTIGLDPENAALYNRRARIYIKLRQSAHALADFAAAVRLDPENPKLRNERALFLLSRGITQQAVEDLNYAIKLSPEFPEAHNNRGLIYIARKDYPRAIDNFSAALRLRSDYSDALNNRGFAYLQSGETDKAVLDFDKAIELKPDDVNSWNNRGMLFLQKEEYAKAVRDFSEAIGRNLFNPQLYLLRRKAFLKLEQFKEARADAAKVEWLGELANLNQRIAHEPADPKRYVDRGEFWSEAREWKRALADFDRAIKINYQLVAAYTGRAAVHLMQENFKKAIADCKLAIAIEPHQEAFSIRGDAHFKTAAYESAIADYTEAKRIDSSVAQAYFLRSQELQETGKQEQASQALEQALALDPSLRQAPQ
jgi:tetratricopeptide (TPR) repeat protein